MVQRVVERHLWLDLYPQAPPEVNQLFMVSVEDALYFTVFTQFHTVFRESTLKASFRLRQEANIGYEW